MRVRALVWGLAGSAVLLCGCRPELAQGSNGREEMMWQQAIRESYPGNRAPQVAPPSIADRYSAKLVEQETTVTVSETETAYDPMTPAAESDPAAETDRAAAASGPVEAVTPTEAVAPAEAVAPTEATESAEPAASAPAEGDTTYVVKAGDTLGGIARRFYGDARCYDIIMKANRDQVRTPKSLRPGMKLVIPKL